MQPRCDVHMLTLDEPEHWREACMDSLRGAPIQLHVLPGIRGRVGAARAAGYSRGELPLVSFVDPDDIYEASAFTALADSLDRSTCATLAYTDEALMTDHGLHAGILRSSGYSSHRHADSAAFVHGLIMMRRDAVESVLDEVARTANFADWVTTLLVARLGTVLHLPVIGRRWRQHTRQSHLAGDRDAVRRVRQFSQRWR